MKLHGAKVLVTGASGGIGSAVVAQLLNRGAQVLLVGRDERALHRLAAEHDAHRMLFGIHATDLASADARSELCAIARQWRGGVNILINNAGLNPFGLYEDLTPAQIDQALVVNLGVTMHLCHSLLPHLRSVAPAAIVNIGSVFGAIGYPGYAVYSATKFAVRGFTEALRRELRGSGVLVQYVAPRATRTPMNSPAVEQMNRELDVAVDPPERVAEEIVRAFDSQRPSTVIGWPEKLFVKLNALLPALVDRALYKQLPVIRRYARSVAERDSLHPTPSAIEPQRTIA